MQLAKKVDQGTNIGDNSLVQDLENEEDANPFEEEGSNHQVEDPYLAENLRQYQEIETLKAEAFNSELRNKQLEREAADLKAKLKERDDLVLKQENALKEQKEKLSEKGDKIKVLEAKLFGRDESIQNLLNKIELMKNQNENLFRDLDASFMMNKSKLDVSNISNTTKFAPNEVNVSFGQEPHTDRFNTAVDCTFVSTLKNLKNPATDVS